MTEQPLFVRIAYQAPVFLLAIAGTIYAFTVFTNYKEDTTKITNAAFLIMASLAALSFSFARVIETERKLPPLQDTS